MSKVYKTGDRVYGKGTFGHWWTVVKQRLDIKDQIYEDDLVCSDPDYDLISLEGCPIEVQGIFDCSNTELTSLKNGPSVVHKDYMCVCCKLDSLEGVATDIGGSICFSYNTVTSLEGLQKVGESLIGSGNRLLTLGHCPANLENLKVDGNLIIGLYGLFEVKIRGDIDISDNKIESLEGIQSKILGRFDCSNNNLESLAKGPTEVYGDIDLSVNPIYTLEGGPTIAGGNFMLCSGELRNLQHSPNIINGDFIVECNILHTLQGGPECVKGNFCVNNNNLRSLAHAPRYVKGNFSCKYNRTLGQALCCKDTTIDGDFVLGISTSSMPEVKGQKKIILEDYNHEI